MDDVKPKQEALARLEEAEAEESSDESQEIPEAAEDHTHQMLENEDAQRQEKADREPLEQESEKLPSRSRKGRRWKRGRTKDGQSDRSGIDSEL